MLTVIEICGGGGGQALGLEQAGFEPLAVVENDPHCCATLRLNRPNWNVVEDDVRNFSATPYSGVDLFAGGVPCPPFSIAGKQLGPNDERDLFPEALRLVSECRPKAVMLENVRGLLSSKFDDYRKGIEASLRGLGYSSEWRLLTSSDYGVPQLRPRAILVAMRNDVADFSWPEPHTEIVTIYDAIGEMIVSNGWNPPPGWKEAVSRVAPTIVGGSKKHGGPDLGPSRAKKSWADLGINGASLGNAPPSSEDVIPRLTVPMVARIQGFPREWEFSGKKTAAYRQVGNAFPPPVARAVGLQIANAILSRSEMALAG